MAITHNLHLEVQEHGRLLRNLREMGKLCARARDNDYTAIQEMPQRITSIAKVRQAIIDAPITNSRRAEILSAGIPSEIGSIFAKLPAIRNHIRGLTQSVTNVYDDSDGRVQTIIFAGVEDQVLSTAHPVLYSLIIDVLSHFPDL